MNKFDQLLNHWAASRVTPGRQAGEISEIDRDALLRLALKVSEEASPESRCREMTLELTCLARGFLELNERGFTGQLLLGQLEEGVLHRLARLAARLPDDQ